MLLVAHADVAPSSALFRPWLKRLILRREKPGRGIHPGTIVLIAGTVQALCSLMLWMGTGNSARLLSVLVVSASVHLGLLLLALDWARSEPGPGAIDNASGLAVAAAAAAALQEKPLSNTEVWVVATGAREPDGGGMRAFLHQFGASLPRENTYIINVDDVGRGRLHYAVSEGRWNRIAYRPSLPAAAERVASRPPFLEVGEVALVGTTDAGQATRSGYRAVTLCSLEKGRRPVVLHNPEDRLDAVQGTSLAEALEFTLALVREVDELLAWEENRKTRRDRAESDTAVGAEPSAS